MSKYKNPIELSKQSLKRRFVNVPNVRPNPTDGYDQDVQQSNQQEAALQSINFEPIDNSSFVPIVNEYLNFSDEFEQQTLSDTDSNSDDSRDESVENETIDDFLRNWVIESNIPQNAVSSLLKYLKNHGHPNLPQDCRTLMKTPKTRIVIPVYPGNYVHIGLKNGLNKYLASAEFDTTLQKEVLLDFNIDGVPVSKSSTECFWPILCRVVNVKKPMVFVVGVYNGMQKPKCFEKFLSPFIDELLCLIETYSFQNVPIKVKIRAIVCDAPARAAILGIKGHSAYHGCGKCTIEGEYVANRVVFIGEGLPRTDLSFRTRRDEDHHNYASPFERLPIDMVKQFPHDYLHVVLLGVVRKLLRMWISGKPNSLLPSRSTLKISEILEKLGKSQPKEFQRRARKLSNINYFKGSELRTFLLYTGPFVLKNILPDDKYSHFMLLHSAILILCCEKNTQKIQVAEEMLKVFVADYANLYGVENISFNVHSLLHIVDDVKLYGNLDSYSAFSFESYMQVIKRLLKKNNQNLAQLSNRLEEIYAFDKISNNSKASYPLLKQKSNERGNAIFTAVETKNFKISNAERNKWIMSDKREIIEFHHAEKLNDAIMVYGKKMSNLSNFYETPIESQKFNIFSALPNESALLSWNLDSIKFKLFMMQNDGSPNLVFFPLLHCHNGTH